MTPRSHVTEDTSQTLGLQALTRAAQRAGLDVTETATQDALRALATPQGMSLLMFFVSEGRRTQDAQLLFSSSENGLGITVSYIPLEDTDNGN